MDRLTLSSCLEEATAVLASSVKALLDADGACVVLREGDQCRYVNEDAIGPLWKGNRYPMSSCISGWCMTHRQSAAIPDVYLDDRIPHEAYRSTFVRSLVISPIDAERPVGALGAYWADTHSATINEIAVLEGLAAAVVTLSSRGLPSFAEFRRRDKQQCMAATKNDCDGMALRP